MGDIECSDVVIMGDAEFNGAIKSRDVKVMGDSTFQSNINARELNIYGDTTLRGRGILGVLKVRGDFKSYSQLEIKDKSIIMGNCEIKEDLKVKYIKIMGSINLDKNIYFDIINVLGEIKIIGNCEGNYFYSKGIAKIKGLLSAEKIEIVPKEISEIEEIGGSEMIIRKSRGISILKGKVISKLIEGDNIILENTNCNIVRGHDINILSGCTIDKIEYTGELTIDKNSKVGEKICLKN